MADLVVSLSMFEQAQVETHVRMQARSEAVRDHEEWQQEGERRRRREAELEAQAGIAWGQPDYFEKSEAIREQVRREMLREKWAREGGPESYARRTVFIHAQSFVSTLAVLQRSLLALRRYPFEPAVAAGIKKAADEFAAALPGLKGVRDSVAHVEERVRGEAHGKKIKTQPVSNSLIHAPGGGAMVVSALNNQRYGGTIADGTYAEVEVADATTEVARAAVQAVDDALPWRPGHWHFEPSS
ncbi:MAG: hypothetical protein M3459_11575 [Actinomycetota bacterium]|nr:hypothetical protein [Actinomycetota bacterium]